MSEEKNHFELKETQPSQASKVGKIKKQKGTWSKEEDEILRELVKNKCSKTWTIIAREFRERYPLNARSSEQCRQRWKSVLLPERKTTGWSEEEESILFSSHVSIGNRWKEIATLLPGRTEYDVKNHFYSKFRGFINQILRDFKKHHVLEQRGIEKKFYNQKKIINLIKKHNKQLTKINKDSVLELIEKDYLKKKEKKKEQQYIQAQNDFDDSIGKLIGITENNIIAEKGYIEELNKISTNQSTREDESSNTFSYENEIKEEAQQPQGLNLENFSPAIQASNFSYPQISQLYSQPYQNGIYYLPQSLNYFQALDTFQPLYYQQLPILFISVNNCNN